MKSLRMPSAAVFSVLLGGLWTCACDKDEKPDCGGHEVGDQWEAEDGCNTCSCTDSGVECTEIQCPPATCEGGHAVGESWQDDDGCNTCSCMEDLQVACTQMACPKTCEGGHLPGDTWDARDGCNSCECTEELVIACTAMACPQTCEGGHVPGETWDAEDGCNTCTCTDGLQIACTEMACPKTCEDGHLPGDTWDADDGCNTCTCTENLQTACTEMACPETCEDGHLPGDKWDADDGCNTCTCTEDLQIACTEMACPETCIDGHLPGETWEAEDGCNACACTEDLQIACTAMICPETCEGGYLPGESFPAGDGCNTCSCMANLEIACTKMLCPPSCATIEADYQVLVESGASCDKDADCQLLYGQCWTGLGGCYEFVNQSVSQAELEGLGQKYKDAGCSGAVCKCAPPPLPACVDGICAAKPDSVGKWTRVEGKFTKEGGFFYQFTGYELAELLVTVYSQPDKVKCEVPVTETDTAPLLPAAEAVDWGSVKPTYKNPDNPFCCCDQFVYALDVVLTAEDGGLTKISTNWCDESLMGGDMPEPLLSFVESFLLVCGTAAQECN